MSDSLFQTLNVSTVQSNLEELLCRTARKKGRIEIDNGDGTSCVVISKSELDDLERALEILADGEAGRAMHQAIEQFAGMSRGSLPGPS